MAEGSKAIARTGDFEHIAPMAGSGKGKARDARAAILALLDERAADATICPSEAARSIAAAAGRADWRAEMADVHAAADGLVAEGLVRLTWKGVALPARGGPYRIGRAPGASPRPARLAEAAP